jgi:hypothetical protein
VAKLFDYARAQGTAVRLLERFAQGGTVYVEPGTPTGNEWDPQPGTPTEYPVSAVKISGNKFEQYVAGGLIVATDVLLYVAPFGVEPTMAGLMRIDGVDHQIVLIDKESFGLPLAWTIGCRR